MEFWTGFILIKIGAAIIALAFLVSPHIRKQVFMQKPSFPKGKGIVFLLNQAIGGIAGILQNLSIDIVPLGMLAFVNALEGSKYVFILLLAGIISFRFPKLLKEEMSKGVVLQKLISVILIIVGVTILAFQNTI